MNRRLLQKQEEDFRLQLEATKAKAALSRESSAISRENSQSNESEQIIESS